MCVGGDSSELTVTHTTGVGTPYYQWYRSIDNGVTYTAVTGENLISFTPPTYTTVGTYFYYVSVDYDGSGCDAVSSALAQVNVLSDPLLTLNISTQQLCLGSTPTDLIVTATGGADPSSYTYEWYDASDTSTPVGTGSTYTPPTVPVGTTDYYVVVTTTASGCSTTSGNTTVDVIPAPEFTQQPQPTQTVCLDGSTTDLTVSVQNFVGTATYQWFENSVPSNTGGTLLTETSSTFTPPSTPTGTKYYYCEVSFSEGGCTLITSNLAQVDVGQVPNIQDEQFIICSEEPINFDPSSIAGNTVPIGTTYSWVVSSPNLDITGQTAENDQVSFVQDLTNETNQIQILTYTVVPTSGDIGNCVGDPFIIVVTVNPKPAIADKLDQICSNTSFTLDLASGDADPTDIIPNNTTYTWTVNDNPNITGESNSVGSSSLVTQTLINESNSTQIVTYVITPTTSLGCVGDTFNLTVSVDPKPTITDKVAVICSGESFLVQPTNSPPGNIVPAGTTYTWTVAANNDVQGELAQTVPQSSISQALTNDSFVDQILFYEVTPSTNGCDGNPFTVTVTVKPEPTISILTNDTQLGCSGDTFGAVTFDSTVANTTYQWELQNTTVPLLVSGYPTNGNGDFPSLVLENGLTMAFTLIYEVTPTAAGCEGPPLVFEITINPVPVLLFSDNDQILCNMDASAPVTISSTTPDVNIQWTIPNPPNAADLIGVSQLSGAASIPSMVLENKTQAPIDLVFEASATTNDASACPGSNFYYTITVLPSAEINPISDEIVCSTYNTPVININTPTSPSGSITYTWDFTFAGLNLSGYLTSGLGTQIPSQVVQNATNVVERLEYTITPYINGCPGIVEVVNLFIDPTPEIQDMTATICSEDTFDVLPVNDSPIGPNIVPAGTTYTWTVAANNDVEGELAQTVPQSSISQDLINTSHVDQIVTYTVEPTTVDGCIGQTFQVDITVEPRPIVTDKFESICSGDAFDVVPVNTPPGQIVPANTLYTWTVSTNPFISGSSDQTTPVGGISQILTSISDVTETIVYTVTPISGSCIGLDFDITVSVSPRPFIEDVVLTPICSEDTFVYVPVTGVPNASIIVPAGTTYTWTVIDNLDVEGDINESTPQVSISQTLENTSSVVQSVIYEVTPISSGCQGPPFVLSIDVKPRPHVINMPQMTNTQCSGEPFIILPQDGIPDAGTIIPAGTTYTWVVSSPNFDLNGCSNNSTPSATISQTLVNTTNIEQQIGYTVTPEADGCIGEPFDVLIWVEPKPYIPNVIQTLCDSESYVLSPVNGINPDGTTIIPNVTTYTWSDPLVVGSTDLNDVTGWTTAVDAPFFDSGILENNTTDQQTVIFTITPTYFVTSNPLIAQCVGDDFTITITLNPSPEMNEVITDVACSYSNPICGASIELSPIGGNPFTYEWIYLTDLSILLPNSTDEDQYDLCPGDYQVTVLDDFGCSYVFQYTIEPPTPIDFQIETLVNISCNNVNVPPCDGYIDLGISGGTAPYVSMEWFTESMSGSNEFDVIVATNTDVLTNACEGNYVLVVIDDNGCEFTSPIYTIENLNTPIIVLNETVSDYNNFEISCNNSTDGFVHVDLTGGSGTFTYTFESGGSFYTDSDLSTPNFLEFDNLPAGDYTLTITDANCPYDIIRNFTLTEPTVLSGLATLTSDPIDCFGETETYDITASGGVPPYTGTGSYTFAAGTNSVIITDANGCSTTVQVTVVEPPVLSATATIINPIPCFGETATIEVVAAGGTPPYTGDGMFTVSTGIFVYTVTDGNNCTYTDSIQVDEPEELTFTIDSITDPTCSPDWSYTNGSICITISGGTNPVPVGTGWLSYGNGEWCLENLSEGAYVVTVTDDNNCPTKTENITLMRPPAIDAFITSTQSVDCSAQTITQTNYIFVEGGSPPYTITWSGGDVCDPATQQCMQTTVSGTYTAFIHDTESLANGCPPIEVDVVVDLEELGDASFTYTSPSTLFCSVLSMNDPIQFTDTSTGDVISVDWDFGDGTSVIGDPNPSHIYTDSGTYTVTQTVNYPYGCSYSVTEDILITKGYELIVPNAFTPNGDGINDTIRPVFNCMEEITMSIYDTWGGLLYLETSDDIYGWDGLIDGRPAENGNYIIVVKAVTFQGLIVDYNGPITLLK